MATLEVPTITRPTEVPTIELFWSSFREFCEQENMYPSSDFTLRTAQLLLRRIATEDLVSMAELEAPPTKRLMDTTWYYSNLAYIAAAIDLLVEARMLTPDQDLLPEYAFDYTLMALSNKRTFIKADPNGYSVLVVA